MTFQDKIHELANRLLLGTSQGTIKWSETAEEDSFRAMLNTGLVRVERLPAGVLPMDNYCLLVLDERNRELARYVPDQPERVLTLRNLWELAGRSARNAEHKIDSRLKEVETRVTMK